MSFNVKNIMIKDDILMDFSNFQKYFYSLPQIVKNQESFKIEGSQMSGGMAVVGGISIDVEGTENLSDYITSGSNGYLLGKITVSTRNVTPPNFELIFTTTILSDEFEYAEAFKEGGGAYKDFDTTNIVYFKLYYFDGSNFEDLRMYDMLTTNKLEFDGTTLTSTVNNNPASVNFGTLVNVEQRVIYEDSTSYNDINYVNFDTFCRDIVRDNPKKIIKFVDISKFSNLKTGIKNEYGIDSTATIIINAGSSVTSTSKITVMSNNSSATGDAYYKEFTGSKYSSLSDSEFETSNLSKNNFLREIVVAGDGGDGGGTVIEDDTPPTIMIFEDEHVQGDTFNLTDWEKYEKIIFRLRYDDGTSAAGVFLEVPLSPNDTNQYGSISQRSSSSTGVPILNTWTLRLTNDGLNFGNQFVIADTQLFSVHSASEQGTVTTSEFRLLSAEAVGKNRRTILV